MPCQEPPIAMSTWQAAIHVRKGCTVLMSGNQLPVQNSDDADIGMQFIIYNTYIYIYYIYSNKDYALQSVLHMQYISRYIVWIYILGMYSTFGIGKCSG